MGCDCARGLKLTFGNECVFDVALDLERRGRIKRLHRSYFATVGNATSVERAKNYGTEIAAKLVNEGVQAVIFTST